MLDTPPELPGCESFRMTLREFERTRERLEFWDAHTEIAWQVRDVYMQHEAPTKRLAWLASRIASVRGSMIDCYGSVSLTRLEAAGRQRWVMQADQIVCLNRPCSRPEGPVVRVGEDDLPDIVLEADLAPPPPVASFPLVDLAGREGLPPRPMRHAEAILALMDAAVHARRLPPAVQDPFHPNPLDGAAAREDHPPPAVEVPAAPLPLRDVSIRGHPPPLPVRQAAARSALVGISAGERENGHSRTSARRASNTARISSISASWSPRRSFCEGLPSHAVSVSSLGQGERRPALLHQPREVKTSAIADGNGKPTS